MDAGIYEHLMTLFVLVGDTPLGKMDTDQMNAVIDVLDITMATIRNANELLANERSAGVLENSKDAVREIRSAGETKKKKTSLRKNLEQFGWNNLKPSYVFDVIGSKTLTNLYESLRSGEDIPPLPRFCTTSPCRKRDTRLRSTTRLSTSSRNTGRSTARLPLRCRPCMTISTRRASTNWRRPECTRKSIKSPKP